MKVLMVAPTSFFADRGCHVRILGEIRGLQELGHEVVLCTYPLGRDVPGIRTCRTWPVPWYRKVTAGPSWHKYYIDLLLLGLVWRWIRHWRPDVVHAHLHEGGCIAALALGKRRIPLVLDYQGSLSAEVVAHGFTGPRSPQSRWLRRLERWIDHRADVVLTSSDHGKADLSSAFGVPEDRIHVVNDGVDVHQFRPGSNGHLIRERYGIPATRPLIIYTGLLNAYQGIDLLLDAFKELKSRQLEFHALLVGYPDVERYRAKAARLGLGDEVTLTGRVPFEEVPELLAASDLAVSAKLPGSEGNLKLFSYLASGLPTVAFDTPLNREVIGETGALVTGVEPAAFAEGIAQLLEQRERWSTLGAMARARAAERFSWRPVAQRIVEIYQLLLND
ncbi:MAG: glycosyltransferase family 4 protein [Candidatus Omnitrophica bacterium]|nr:glycosyltransferase family 4 protein [Candidatus Omnitrophota bacterium]